MSWLSRHKILSGIAAVIVVVLIGFGWIVLGPGALAFAGGTPTPLASYNGPNPTGVPKELAGQSLVARGHYLTRAADCEACHTARGGTPFAGGLAFHLPFGTIYSANITSDKDTGIGDWTDAQFVRAVHQGIDDQGQRLYPAMPYASYALLSDADVLAIKAYLFSLKPVHNDVPDDALSFPYNQRWLMAFWSAFFVPDHRFEPVAERSPEWNRGAYLAEGLAHCGECHTPRNLMQGLDNRSKFAGAIQAGWRAYNITGDTATGVGGWSDAELVQYISKGHANGRGTASGPMAEAVDLSFRYLAPGDIRAIVTYLRTVPAVTTFDLPPPAGPAPASHREGVSADVDPHGKALFAGACIGCHNWTGAGQLTPWATLTGARAVNDPTATNVAQIILSGTRPKTAPATVFMPAFGDAYSDVEIAAIANYVTARFGSKPSHITREGVALLRRERS